MTIDALVYAPATLRIARGDTVTWTNRDPFPHTVTASGVFDSGSIAPGASWSWRATRSGSFDYLCTFHPNMKGRLVVE